MQERSKSVLFNTYESFMWTFTDKEEGKYKGVYPIFTVQKLMNHKDIQQTMRYAKLAPDSSRDMVEGLYQ